MFKYGKLALEYFGVESFSIDTLGADPYSIDFAADPDVCTVYPSLDNRFQSDDRLRTFIEEYETGGSAGVEAGDARADIVHVAEEVARAMDPSGDSLLPVGGYAFPLDGLSMEAEEAQGMLWGTNLSIVRLERARGDEIVMGLTGGGMDLTEDIARAYLRLGLRVPFAHCVLPVESGSSRMSERYKLELRAVIDGCRSTCEIVTARAGDSMARLARVIEGLEGDS